MFEYSPQFLEFLEGAVDQIDSIVINDQVYIPANSVDMIANFMAFTYNSFLNANQVCDMEELHALFFIDWLSKLSASIDIKHSEETMPDDISSLEEPGLDT